MTLRNMQRERESHPNVLTQMSHLRYDDLLEEENEAVQIALKRLSAKESYERVYRIRRSVQCSYTHKLLPKDQWTKPEEVRQLSLPTFHNFRTTIEPSLTL